MWRHETEFVYTRIVLRGGSTLCIWYTVYDSHYLLIDDIHRSIYLLNKTYLPLYLLPPQLYKFALPVYFLSNYT